MSRHRTRNHSQYLHNDHEKVNRHSGGYRPYEDMGNIDDREQKHRLETEADVREEDYNVRVMQEREEEILEINHKMHTVNEIYKDLADIIDEQQDLIDNVDNSIELANADVKEGTANVNEARRYSQQPSVFEDPFGNNIKANREKGKTRKSRKKSGKPGKNRSKQHTTTSSKMTSEDELNWKSPFDTIQEDMKEVVNDIKDFGSKMFGACTAPDTNEVNEYAYR